MTDPAPSTDLVAPGPQQQHHSIAKRARGDFDSGQMALIQQTVAKDCNAAELAMFLELCARYELDPFSKQIWAMKIKGTVVVVVSRDGLLALANRHTPAQGFSGPGEFLGCESDIVREHDHFRRFRDPALGTIIEHEYRDEQGKPTADQAKRGKILGAWALVHRRGHFPTYYFGEWATYNTGQNVWRSHPEAMMQKVPETMALRKAFSISGVIGESEVQRQVLTETAAGSAEVEWPEDAELKRNLEVRFEELGYRRAKIRTLINGCTGDDDYLSLIARLDGELHARAASAPVVDGEPVEDRS